MHATSAHTHACIHIHTHACLHMYKHVCLHTDTYTCTNPAYTYRQAVKMRRPAASCRQMCRPSRRSVLAT